MLFLIAMFAYHFLPGKNFLNFIALNKNPFYLLREGGGVIMYGHTVIISISGIYPLYFSLSISLRYSVTKRKEESATAYFLLQEDLKWYD